MSGNRHLHGGAERGASAVEFALVLPLLVLILFGIIELGRLYNMQISLTGAAREGARVMAISNDWTAAESATIAAAPSVSPTPTASRTPATCSPGADIEVRATSDLSYNIPLFRSGVIAIEGRGVMRCGG